MNPLPRPYHSRNRSGIIYVAVLAIATLVLIMAMGALLASRSLARASSLGNDADEAANYAFSAVEMGRLLITNDAYWRTDYSPGAWISSEKVGSGTMSLTVSTADSTFSNMTEDITLLGTGVKGGATQKLKATLHSVITPLTCMSSVLTSNGAASLNGATINAATAGLACNSTVVASGASIGVPVSAVGAVSGSYYQQQVLSGQTAVTLPNASTLFSNSTYITQGTAISYSSISGGNIQKTLLSPASNLYGSTNSQGIYVINCGGKSLQIQNCRIVGTLVLLNAGAVQINNSVNWQPAVADYPCLLIQGGPLQLNMSANSLQENSSDKVSYNAPGTPYPYPTGTTNITYTDSFPSSISGLIYVTGSAVLSTSNACGILIVGGTLQASNTITPTYDSTYFTNPPPGFYTNNLTSDANTYARSVN